MNIVFFTHPEFLGSQSMPRFARMLADGMEERGHQVEFWIPKARLFALPVSDFMKKWCGYIDQYFFFPEEVKKRLKKCSSDTLFVFTDHALGPWVPLVSSRPHAIHCHDFLAQNSALGNIQENPTSWTGKHYQAFIRRGFSKGKNFLSVSRKTGKELEKFLPGSPHLSEVVYNGLNQSFSLSNLTEARSYIAKKINLDLSSGYLLHVGGNQWYKNRVGVIEIYNAWRNSIKQPIPLLLVGPPANSLLMASYLASPYKNDIQLLSGMDDEFVQKAYAGASVFIFPSLAEGFGWPIAEAMASGCPVITTDEAPMTEVAGDAAYFISRKPSEDAAQAAWAFEGARMVEKVLNLSTEEREKIVQNGLANAKRFDSVVALDRIEAIYKQILKASKI